MKSVLTLRRSYAPAARSTRASEFDNRQRWRVALYSHDTMGLGHTRRNLLIAQSLVASGLPIDVLLIRGMQEGISAPLDPGIDCLALPALHKSSDGVYGARTLRMALPELIELRAQILHTALTAYRPDALIVDNVPRGAQQELDLTLGQLRATGRTRCILGLRDVLDEPEAIGREWQRAGNDAAVRDYYDAVWVYGDPRVFDTARAYDFAPETAAKIRYLGYLDQNARLRHMPEASEDLAIDLPPGRLALCLVGGGQDGAELAETFAQTPLPPNTTGVIVTGPFMPAQARARLKAYAVRRQDLRVLTYATEPVWLLRRADWVVAMGGYNTVAEILSFGKRALIVPRVQPRREQLIRAERLQSLGLLDMLHPDHLTPAALGAWLAGDSAPPPRSRIDMRGLERLPMQLMELIDPLYCYPLSRLYRQEEHLLCGSPSRALATF
jgi:predicted glycosyltransferase